MKELSTVVSVHHIILNRDYKFLSDKFILNPTSSDSDAGQLFDCSISPVVELPDQNTMLTFTRPQSCIVSLTDSQGNNYKIGSKDIPAKVSISPYLNSATLTVSCKQSTSPFVGQTLPD